MREDLSKDIKDGVDPLTAIVNEAEVSGDAPSKVAKDLSKGKNYDLVKLWEKRIMKFYHYDLTRYGASFYSVGLHLDLYWPKDIDEYLHNKKSLPWPNYKLTNRPFSYCKWAGQRKFRDIALNSILKKETSKPFQTWRDNKAQIVKLTLSKSNWTEIEPYLNNECFLNPSEIYFVILDGVFDEMPYFDKNEVVAQYPELSEKI
jgi:hypothetical protein